MGPLIPSRWGVSEYSPHQMMQQETVANYCWESENPPTEELGMILDRSGEKDIEASIIKLVICIL